ncbi:Ankyrin repeat-containing protein 42 [Elsinoe fawcettii]|nr:Ankyrin repeat-containing protein 42 [Elsinoe fawcettii]
MTTSNQSQFDANYGGLQIAQSTGDIHHYHQGAPQRTLLKREMPVHREDLSSKRRRMEPYCPGSETTGNTMLEIGDVFEFLHFEEIEDRLTNIRTCLSRTCKWLLEDARYKDWLHVNDHHNGYSFFWIKGKPGSGKSILAKFILGQVKASLPDATTISFFFNARGTALEKSTVGLYRSLLLQLLALCKNDGCWRSAPSWKHWPFREGDNMNTTILKQLLLELVQTLHPPQLVLIIDALDECGEAEIRDMISFFEDLAEEAADHNWDFRVLFFSRHYPHITVRQCTELVLEEQSGHTQDINLFVSRKLKLGNNKQLSSIKNDIRDRSSGIFMWVVLVVDILNTTYDRGHIQAVRQKLKEIPNNLSELFKDILTRDGQDMDAMLLSLQWVLYSFRPLRRDELYFAMVTELYPDQSPAPWDPEEVSFEDMARFIVSSSKGLVEITKSKKGTAQFIHESARDFLLKDHGLQQIWSQLKLDADVPGLSHDKLKQCCHKYLTFDIAEQLRSSGDSSAASSSSGATRVRETAMSKFPFMDYATRHVFMHADLAQSYNVDQKHFLAHFDLGAWVRKKNIIERYKVRQLPEETNLLYIFAELSCDNLVRLAPNDDWNAGLPAGRHHNPLFVAMATGDTEMFDAILEQDSKLHPNGRQFPFACNNGFSYLSTQAPERLFRFLAFYSGPQNWTGKDSTTLLSWSANTGQAELVELLLRNGADVNAQGGFHGNALQAASAKGHDKIVELLLGNGVDVNAQGGEYGNALQAASAKGHDKIVELLLGNGVDVNAQGGEYGNALQAASAESHDKIVNHQRL